jgi:uncharacterized membrane protein YbhN (UPF0104 family)
MQVRRFWSVPHVERQGSELAVLIVLAALLELAAGVGLAYVAGFSRARAVVSDVRWGWLAVLAGALVLSFVGYFLAYQGIFRVEGGPRLPRRQMHAVVAAGFGGLLAHGWGALDKQALKVAGAGEHGAKARAAGLAGLELAVLALGGWGGAIAVLASGLGVPSPDFSLPWAIIPVPATLIGFWAAERYRDRFRGRRGWRGAVGVFLEAVHLIRELFVRPRWGWAMLGMALFWAADAFALWAGLAAFGTRMNAATLLVGYATGMVFTRRTAPLAGAGILALALPASLWYSGAPLATAVAGVFAYRILVLWLPLPVALASLPTLRTMGERRIAQAERKAA